MFFARRNPPDDLTNPEDVPAFLASEIPDAIRRVRATGAVPMLTYLGSGAYGHVFCDVSGRGFKAGRHDTAANRWSISEEAAWLRAANRVPGVREHVAKYYSYDAANNVLIRECVKQREYHRKNEKKIWELHDRIRGRMIKVGWSAPEFKPESYAVVPGRGPVLFDASSALRVGSNLVRLVTDALAGRVDYPYPLRDLSYDLRAEIPRSVTPEVGKRLEERISREMERRRQPGGLAFG